MSDKVSPLWLDWAREIEAISQTGLHYALNEFDTQRYYRLQVLAAEILSHYSLIPEEKFMDVFTIQKGYATPKVDVRAAVFQEGCLLMVRENMDGGWTLPGGWADVGDVPSQAAERETREEAGLNVRAVKVIGVYDANRRGPLELFHAYKIVFLCQLIGGVPTPSNETSEVAFFAEDEIPLTLSGERTFPRHIKDAFNAMNNPLQPTVFD